jgi:acetoacetate decarboxylase
MANFSFVKTPEEIAYYTSSKNAAWMNNAEGIYIAWASDQEAIEKLLPAPLKAVGPLATAYVINIQEPTFSNSYKEAALILPCAYNGQPAAYALTMLLEGTDNGVFAGREELGIPKKNGNISLSRVGDVAKAKVERYGTTLLELECEIGAYNTPTAQAVFGDRGPGVQSEGKQIFFKFNIDQDENANKTFTNLKLLEVKNQSKFYAWEPATGSVKLQSTMNDPWAELPVRQVIGSAWCKMDIGLVGAKTTPMDNANEIIPYLLTRYDAPFFGYPNRKF